MLIKSPKISVVMPTYNAETHLSKAIDSILAQTFDDFEFLIIDDNSSDRTREIIKAYNDKRIRLIDGCCKGLAAALNQGIREAKGIYIARMDADDVSLPIRFEKQVAYMDIHDDITVLGAWQEHYYENGVKKYIHTPFAKNEELMIAFAFEPSVCHSTVMLRRCDIIENKFFYSEDSPCEDGELWMRVIKTHKFATVQQILGEYLLSENSITEKKRKILSKYETTLRQNYLRDMFGYTLKDKDKYLLNTWEHSFKNMSQKQIYSAVIRLKKILKEMGLAINKKHIVSVSRVHEILNFFYLKISREYYDVKKIYYKLFGIIALIETIQVGNIIGVYLFGYIQILRIIDDKTKSNATKFLEAILCIKNEGKYKVIGILGLKIKIKSRYLQSKQELSRIGQKLSQQLQEAYENINIIKIKQSFGSNTVIIAKGDFFFYRQKKFDIIFKILYARSCGEFPSVHAFYEKLYLKHIQSWNNYCEEESLKQLSDDFLEGFKNLICSIEKYGFDKARPILMSPDGDIHDGSHRLAICFSLNKDIAVTLSEAMYMCKYDYAYFLENKIISTDLADINALEYVKINPHAFIVNIFPVLPIVYDIVVESVLCKYGFIYYKKCLDITYNGCFNLKKINYGCKEWVREHAEKSMGTQEQGKQRVYVFVCHNKEILGKLKKEIRAILNIENFPVHINYERSEAIELAQTYFNENSWYMINNRPYNLISETLDTFIDEFKSYVFSNNYKNDYFCAAGSTPLGVFSIRDIGNFDFLHIYEKISKSKNDKISSHLGELKHYPFSKEDIILNPKNHFYYRGIKFISLKVLEMMKKVRNSLPRDIDDVQNIKKF